MATTSYKDFIGPVVPAAWLNDVDTGTYDWLTQVAGTPNALTAVGPANLPSSGLVAGQNWYLLPASTNTNAVTLNVSGIGAKAVTKNGVAPLIAGDLIAGVVACLSYDGGQFQLLNPQSTLLSSLPVPVNQGGTGAVTAIAARASLAISDEFAFINRLINPGFTINQRSYVSGTALSAGIYAHDRWKAGAGGCTYTYPAVSVGVPLAITITAGSLQQVIEGRNLPEGGTYVFSWAGTAQCKIGGGAYQASPIVTAGNVAGANLTVEIGLGTFSSPQVQSGAVVTPIDYRSYESEFQFCRVYCQQIEAIAGVIVDSTHARCALMYITPMRGAGTITLIGTPTFYNPVGGGGVSSAVSLASATARSAIAIFTVSTLASATAGMAGYFGGPVALVTNEL